MGGACRESCGARMPDRRSPLWLLPNLLSLDAPLVAVAWLYLFARTWRVDYLPAVAYVVLGLAVWSVYIFDRLLDAGLRGTGSDLLQARHWFHLQHKRAFYVTGTVAALTALVLALVAMPIEVLRYAVIGFLLTLIFFAMALFSNQHSRETAYAKNALAGLVFAYGTAVAVHVYRPMYGLGDLMKSREMICFGMLCMLNITAIDVWEKDRQEEDPEEKAGGELSLTVPCILLGAAALVFAVLDREASTRSFFYAILTGAALLQVLNRMRARFSVEALRVLADAALVVPVILFATGSSTL